MLSHYGHINTMHVYLNCGNGSNETYMHRNMLFTPVNRHIHLYNYLFHFRASTTCYETDVKLSGNSWTLYLQSWQCKAIMQLPDMLDLRFSIDCMALCPRRQSSSTFCNSRQFRISQRKWVWLVRWYVVAIIWFCRAMIYKREADFQTN
jgi:hypothetical protein